MHGDIRPVNILVSVDPMARNLYFMGLGYATRFIESHSLRHVSQSTVPMQPRLVASPFSSLTACMGKSFSRRDDLESLGYVLVYFAKGSLPWSDRPDANPVLDRAQAAIGAMVQKKKSTSIEELCRGLPPQFAMYMEYVKALGFKSDPDYRQLGHLFASIVSATGVSPGPGLSLIIPDWVAALLRHKKAARRDSFLADARTRGRPMVAPGGAQTGGSPLALSPRPSPLAPSPSSRPSTAETQHSGGE